MASGFAQLSRLTIRNSSPLLLGSFDIGHNSDRALKVSTPFGIEEKEGSRGCSAWAEGWEEDRKAGLRILQRFTGET
jgi:hypothetical protein